MFAAYVQIMYSRRSRLQRTYENPCHPQCKSCQNRAAGEKQLRALESLVLGLCELQDMRSTHAALSEWGNKQSKARVNIFVGLRDKLRSPSATQQQNHKYNNATLALRRYNTSIHAKLTKDKTTFATGHVGRKMHMSSTVVTLACFPSRRNTVYTCIHEHIRHSSAEAITTFATGHVGCKIHTIRTTVSSVVTPVSSFSFETRQVFHVSMNAFAIAPQ
eukprot:scpid53922/ scgid17576/ 